ncbi:two-component system chemotaxis response regulator CheB [Pontibacter ummariensis]|uniref:protein-glutamate methylesterase n=1 Tax=Pontibacter ummariensis TaxID=1610492 RepID=A0A239J449_9BACT|nr:chemotaxis protein CheB [Pontibacter ummariensis]PRY08849.1 two-component system chemotaxis response regulator CheB [Pontibacter ummariensis]SNT00033.1 two-component system, chemotaxis family, response regulator CheB [Pontibacter ummariensis]
MEAAPKVIVMGGSWGGIQASLSVLQNLPETYSIPIILVLHRLRNQEGSLQEVFDKKLALKAVEIEEKEALRPGYVYLAPANYHVLLEKDHTFSLDVSELENYSRPAIDVTFTSAADVFSENTIGILLSGASKDGSSGLKYIFEKRGMAIVQEPEEAEVDTMPLAAIAMVPGCFILDTERIKAFLLSLHDR